MAGWCAIGLAVLLMVWQLTAVVLIAIVPTAGSASPVLVLSAMLVDVAAGVTLIGLAVALMIWQRGTKRLLSDHGADPRRAWHWTVRVWSAIFVFSVLLGFLSGHGDRSYLMGRYVLRAFALVFLILGVYLMRRRVLALLANPPAPVAPYSLVTGGPGRADLLLPPTPTSEDWNAHLWDPEVQAEIERKRRKAAKDNAGG